MAAQTPKPTRHARADACHATDGRSTPKPIRGKTLGMRADGHADAVSSGASPKPRRLHASTSDGRDRSKLYPKCHAGNSAYALHSTIAHHDLHSPGRRHAKKRARRQHVCMLRGSHLRLAGVYFKRHGGTLSAPKRAMPGRPLLGPCRGTSWCLSLDSTGERKPCKHHHRSLRTVSSGPPPAAYDIVRVHLPCPST